MATSGPGTGDWGLEADTKDWELETGDSEPAIGDWELGTRDSELGTADFLLFSISIVFPFTSPRSLVTNPGFVLVMTNETINHFHYGFKSVEYWIFGSHVFQPLCNNQLRFKLSSRLPRPRNDLPVLNSAGSSLRFMRAGR